MRGDTRGLASGIFAFVAMIIISALLFTMLAPAATDIFGMVSSQTSNPEAQAAIDRREEIWGYMLFFALFLASIAFLSRSVFESRRTV